MLQFQGQIAEDRKKKLKEDYDRKAMEGVTFQPSLCKKSEQILNKRNARINEENVNEANPVSERYKDLYRDA